MDVLVYVDPSPRGEWALALAAQLPAAGASRLHLVATREDVATDPYLLARAGKSLAGAASLTVATREGPAERAVIAEAREGKWGLLVVPPAGRGAVLRMLKGSRVATVVRMVDAPVLVARRPPPRIERILAALSGGESTDAVVAAALEWESRLKARARFVHVTSEVALPGDGGAAARAGGGLERLRAALGRHGRTDALRRREGLVVDEVLDEFEADAHHLLVVGGQGEDASRFGRVDVTERLLLACPGSTLVVPVA
jgi:nucleotide-binding universal stress UspA family protein